MDWQIQRIGRISSVSGQRFQPGDEVLCLIYVGPEGELCRSDILLEEEPVLDLLPESVLGRWRRRVKEKEDEQEAMKAQLKNHEELFLSLYASERSGDSIEVTKHLLALMLERKRVLRAEGVRQTVGKQPYLHVKSRVVYEVPIIEISVAQLKRMHELVGDLIL